MERWYAGSFDLHGVGVRGVGTRSPVRGLYSHRPGQRLFQVLAEGAEYSQDVH